MYTPHFPGPANGPGPHGGGGGQFAVRAPPQSHGAKVNISPHPSTNSQFGASIVQSLHDLIYSNVL